jgi:NADH:ubiquinone oxidoreductase subunit H
MYLVYLHTVLRYRGNFTVTLSLSGFAFPHPIKKGTKVCFFTLHKIWLMYMNSGCVLKFVVPSFRHQKLCSVSWSCRRIACITIHGFPVNL